jgi:hypothetical protein
MTVYVDDAIWHWQGIKWCHLLPDDADELHRFAARLAIKRTSFQSPPKVKAPHYDLTGYERLRAMAPVSCRFPTPATFHTTKTQIGSGTCLLAAEVR